jgi:hypothetical protein
MHSSQQHFRLAIAKVVLTVLATAGVLMAPVTAQAGNVGWAVSVGGGYGGGWRPAAYGQGWGAGYGGYGGWRGGYYGPAYGYPYGYPFAATYYSPPVVYASPPIVTYAAPPQPMVLASQPQPPVWYYCEASGQYFPYVQSCTSGWQTQPAVPPTSAAGNSAPKHAQH